MRSIFVLMALFRLIIAGSDIAFAANHPVVEAPSEREACYTRLPRRVADLLDVPLQICISGMKITPDLTGIHRISITSREIGGEYDLTVRKDDPKDVYIGTARVLDYFGGLGQCQISLGWRVVHGSLYNSVVHVSFEIDPIRLNTSNIRIIGQDGHAPEGTFGYGACNALNSAGEKQNYQFR